MEFKFIDELDLGLTLDLIVLNRDSQRYSVLLYQHEGVLFADENRISNNIPVESQFESFFEKAKTENTDLALTPEYSCPWVVIGSILNDKDKWINKKKLWIVGAESITLDQIASFKEENESNEIIIYYDQRVHQENRHFVDPVLYIFKAQKDGDQKLVILIQFKTHHMGVYGDGIIERNNLIRGKEIYILRNPTNSINLITLICSDALNFRDYLTDENRLHLDWVDKPYLIFHPQLNPKPTDNGFIDFRKYIFQTNDKEIISLNWQANTLIAGHKINHCSSRSGFYLKSNEINFEDLIRFNNNHKLGLYYFYNKKDRHSYIFSSIPHVFLVETTPVKISGVQQVQARRDGPEVKKVFEYSNEDNEFKIMDIVDDFQIEYLNSTACNNQFLRGYDNCVFEKERLACISIGKIDNRARNFWWKIQSMYSVYMDENNEINKRLTVARNESDDSMNIKSRFIEAINELQAIIDNKDLFPDSLNTLKNEDLILSYNNDSRINDFRYNISTLNGEFKGATLAYIGAAPESYVDITFAKLRDLFNINENGREKVVVFYKLGNDIMLKWDTHFGNVINPNDFDDTSILKSEEL